MRGEFGELGLVAVGEDDDSEMLVRETRDAV